MQLQVSLGAMLEEEVLLIVGQTTGTDEVPFTVIRTDTHRVTDHHTLHTTSKYIILTLTYHLCAGAGAGNGHKRFGARVETLF